MYRLWIALLAFCAIFTVVGVADIAGTPVAAAQETASPLAVVERFYAWYLAYLTPDAEGNFANPLVDRAYRDSVYLTPELIARLDVRLDSDEPLWVDPFLCAQDMPQDFTTTLIEQSEGTAAVLLEQRFGLNLYTVTVALRAVGVSWQIEDVTCGETVTPAGVVSRFYEQYIAYGRYDPTTGTARNPLQDGAYRDADLLSASLIADLDGLVAAGGGIADPLLCAQDLPAGVGADTIRADEETALVALRQYFSGMASPRTIAVALVQEDGGWRIDGVRCELAAEEAIALVYGQYADHARRTIDQGEPNDLLRNPMIPWRAYLADALLAELAAKAADGPRLADPILCAQDIPAAFTVEAAEDGAYRVSGLFPAGSETMTAYPLARVQVEAGSTGWLITAIRCEAR